MVNLVGTVRNSIIPYSTFEDRAVNKDIESLAIKYFIELSMSSE
jgi:hypothetical protein